MKTCSEDDDCYTEEMTFDGDETIFSQVEEVLCDDESITTTTAPTKTRSNVVRFDSSVKVYSIPSHTEYTRKERKSCWYTSKEKKLREMKLATIIERIQNNGMEQQQQRGLFLASPSSPS